MAFVHGAGTPARAVLAGSSVAAGLALLAGALTPAAVLAVSLLLLARLAEGAGQTTLLLLVMAVALGLLGPGAYSVDARLFGRREIEVPRGPRG